MKDHVPLRAAKKTELVEEIIKSACFWILPYKNLIFAILFLICSESKVSLRFLIQYLKPENNASDSKLKFKLYFVINS